MDHMPPDEDPPEEGEELWEDFKKISLFAAKLIAITLFAFMWLMLPHVTAFWTTCWIAAIWFFWPKGKSHGKA